MTTTDNGSGSGKTGTAVLVPPVLLAYASAAPAEVVPEGMKLYKLDPAGLGAYQKRAVVIRVCLESVVLLVCCCAVCFWTLGTHGVLRWQALAASALTCGLIYLPFALWGVFKAYRTATRRWMAYRLYLGDGVIRQTRYGRPEITLRREEVKAVSEASWGGWLVVAGKKTGSAIIVPRSVFEFEEVRAVLASWGPIRPARLTLRGLWALAVLGVFLAAMFVAPLVVVLARRPVIWGPAAGFVVLIQGWLFWRKVRGRSTQSWGSLAWGLVLLGLVAWRILSWRWGF